MRNHTRHLLFVMPAFTPYPGGAERYAHALARQLVARDYTITVVTSTAREAADFWNGRAPELSVRNGGNNAEIPGVTVLRCGVRPFPGGRSALLAWRKAMVTLSDLPGEQTAVLDRMAAWIPPLQGLPDLFPKVKQPVDLVHGFNISWEYALLAGAAYAQRAGLPFVVTPFMHFGVGGRDRVARNSTMDHQRTLLREAARVQVMTSSEQAYLANHAITADNVDVIGGGLTVLLADAAAEQPDFDLPRPFALFLGYADVEKGVGDAIEAVLQLVGRGQDLHLVLAGEISTAVAQQLDRLSAEERARIHTVGVVDEPAKAVLFAQTEMLLLPSRIDSFGLVILEAWSHGVPVIGARAGGIPGLIDHGRDGLLVPFGDVEALASAMQRLLVDPEMRAAMGSSGRDKLAAQYTWPRVTERVLASYARAMASGEQLK